jgi:ABC-type nickel/cobalt efflux system permease component RcnA
MKRIFQFKFYEKISILLLILLATLLIFSYISNLRIIEGKGYKKFEKGDTGEKEHRQSVNKKKGERDKSEKAEKKAYGSHRKMVGR